MRKAFVTGGAGFIGQHLVRKLLADLIEVTVFDNLSTGRRLDLAPFERDPKFRFVFGDVRDLAAMTTEMAGHDVVWHLAANGDIPRGQKDTRWDFDNNTSGTHNVLEAMRANGVHEILFSSTAAVYGDGAANRVPLAEIHGPLLPISLYAASKIGGEAIISAYCHLFGFRGWIFRFANVVGGRMNHGLLWDMIVKLRQNPSEVEVWGDGWGEKPFVLVDDILWGMTVAYRAAREKSCDVYNLGTPTYTVIEDAVKIVIEEMGLKDVKLNYTGGARGFPGDVPIVRFDPRKMESYGFRTSHTSTEAVRIAARRLIDGAM